MENDLTLIGRSYLNGKPLEINISNGKISAVKPASGIFPEDIYIGPGLFDIQVNGYAGLDYNEIQKNLIDLAKISKKLYEQGVTSHFPTIITASPDQFSKLIHQVMQLRELDELAKESIAGLHIEGPFISPEDGPRGAHPREHVIQPNWGLIENWQKEAEGLIRMITFSPEWENSVQFVESCVKHGILVSIGHTNASPKQIVDAVRAGASLSTHLGNGMHPTLARHPNYLWSQLAEEGLSATIIADGFHLPREVIKVFKKVKDKNLILVSDSVSLAGMPPGDYNSPIGGEVTLTSEGKLHLSSNPKILAGSAMNLRQGVTFLLKNNLATIQEAWEMASIRPYQLFDKGFDSFMVGENADLVVARINIDKHFQILKTIKNGTVVYST
ncbi:amidohydrolase family protein [Algoriphagus sp. SE2]|uniref:N-acetylglucosamine-6-phosphate deacetylase n=1 Tax=Algoriphagus sp. SE2 TaxID=3141536 RepID=UPI0031CD6C24